jgi:hypothetical protein
VDNTFVGEHVVATLEQPSSESMGMVGLIVSDHAGTLRTEGVLGSPAGRITSDQLDLLVESGHAQRVDPIPLGLSKRPGAALWLGRRFVDEAAALDLPIPPVPAQHSIRGADGEFWVAPAAHVWYVLDFWLLHAFRQIVETKDPKIARLMTWALPRREESQAARWLTADGSLSKHREMEWALRVHTDNVEGRISLDALTQRFGSLIEKAENSRKTQVVGLTAPAKGGDKEIAEIIADKKDVPNASFGAWLREEAGRLGHPTAKRRDLQVLGHKIISDRGELAIFLEVLEAFHLRPAQSFVIEGIRHRKVLESVRSLVGDDVFFFAYVDRPLAERRKLLREKENLTESEIDTVLDDPTELEIPELESEADIRLDMRKGADAEGKRLMEQLV